MYTLRIFQGLENSKNIYIYIYIYILVCSILNSVRTSHMYLIVSIFKFIRVYANMREVTTNE